MNIGSPTQKTDFTLDVFGRYICNTFEEAMAASDAVFRAGATDTNGNPLPPRGDLRPFDYIVIGGGTFGSAVAEHIWNRTGSRSERILVLEGGPFALPEHVQNLPMMQTGEVWGLPWNSDQPNLQFQGLAYCLGGRSVFWGGWSPRLLDSELPTSVWPKPVLDDLNAQKLLNGDNGYFRQSGEQIGVTETNDFVFGELHHALREQLFKAINASAITDAMPLASLPDAPPVEIRSPAVPTPAELADLLGIPLPSPLPPTAVTDMRNALKLEAPLAVQGRGAHSGFFPMNKFSAVPLLIRAARGAFNESPGDDVKKRLMVVPRCHVSSLSVTNDANGRRVDGINTERGFISVPPDTKVIIALGTIESTRLALNSFGDDGRIGRNLMAHLRSNVNIRVPRAALAALAALLPTIKALQSSALLLKGQHQFTDGTKGHFHLQITASGLGSTGSDSEAELFQKLPDIDGLEQHLQATDTHVVITLRGIGEMQPGNPNCNITLDLDPNQQDYGVRKAWVNLVPTAKDKELWDAMDKASDDVAHAFGGGLDFEVFTPQGIKIAKPAAGATPRTDLKTLLFYTSKIDSNPQNKGRRDPLGTTHHEAGTLRMGTDPTKSVTNADCRFHDVKNAYVVGPALFPTIGSPNPMLTGIALARRLGDHLVPPPNPPPAEAGFTNLFDGTQKSATFFAEWLMAGGGGFKMVGRTLVAQPGNGIGLLYYTAKQFNNFTLRLDFCLPHPRGNSNDNSGVFVRFRDPRKPVLPGTPGPDVPGNAATVAVDTGYEIQIDEEARGDTRKSEHDGFFFNRTGAIYKIKTQGTAPGQQNYTNNQQLAPGVWHTYEIKVTDRTYAVKLNGQPATTFTADQTDPNEQFRGRKKSEDPDSGFIGLQVHTGTVAFANIRIQG